MNYPFGRVQSTIAYEIKISGLGVHSGENVNMTISPAPEGHGIVFICDFAIPNNADWC